MNRFARDFFQRRHARAHLDQSAAAQRDHAALDGLLLQFHCRGADQDQLADLVVDLHHFVQTAAALVSGVVADAAALALLNLDGPRFLRA